MSDLILLGAVPPTELSEARLQLHYAAQVPAAVGHALIAPRADDSQSNLGWDGVFGALIGYETPQGYRVGLRCHDIAVIVLSDGQLVAEHPLADITLGDGINWVREKLSRLAGTTLPATIEMRDYELPPHAIDSGAPFTCKHPAAFAEVGRWFAHADHILREVSAQYATVSPTRVWPHHFDMGVLITLDPDKDAEEARSVGLGFSPGDAAIPEPYWYAYAYPSPTVTDPPRLDGGGTWNTDGFTGPLLRGSALVTQATGAAQLAQSRAFVTSAAKVCHELLGVVAGG